MSRVEPPTLLVGEDPSSLRPLPVADSELSRLAVDLWQPLAGHPGKRRGSPNVIGSVEGGACFVVPAAAIAHFGTRGDALRYAGHLAARPRQRGHEYIDALVWAEDGPSDRPLERLAIPAKGACGVGFLAGAERLIVWHLGPTGTLPRSDPTPSWLDAVQRAAGGPRDAVLPALEAIRADCDDAGDVEALARALAEIAGASPRLYVYFEDKIDHKEPADDARRWRPRPSPYVGEAWQPAVVRYADPQPDDSVDVFLRLRYGCPGRIAGLGVAVRVIRPGGVDEIPGIPAPPDCGGQHWFRFDLELES